MTRDELLKRFPNASPAFLRSNSNDAITRLSARQIAKPQPRPALVASPQGEGAGKRSVEPGAHYRVRFTVFAVRPRDWDNLAASCKQLQDAIVEAGWLPDDDWKTLEGTVVSAKAATENEERTEVTIERMK
jgi:hypothetical protein